MAEGAAKKENYRIAHEHVMTALEVVTTIIKSAATMIDNALVCACPKHLGMRRYVDEIKERQASMDVETQVDQDSVDAAVYLLLSFSSRPDATLLPCRKSKRDQLQRLRGTNYWLSRRHCSSKRPWMRRERGGDCWCGLQCCTSRMVACGVRSCVDERTYVRNMH